MQEITQTTNLKKRFFLSDHKEIDEVFCLIDELSDSQLKELVKLSFKNKFNLKFIEKQNNFFQENIRLHIFLIILY